MSETTAIEWCDATWSPWEGCTKVSPGCDHCYAEGMNRWLRKGANWGPGAPRRIYSEDHWQKPIKWQRDATKFDTLHGRHRRVFPSVCDPFDNEALPLERERFFGLIRMTPALDWLLLTKRIGNAKAMLPADWCDGYPNVWLGATVVNQEEADRDIPKLLALPARLRFLSIEPMLGPIDLHRSLLIAAGDELSNDFAADTRIGWVISGGESGPKARPSHPDWHRSLRDQCATAGVPFLFKQWGEYAPGGSDVAGSVTAKAIDIGGALRSVGEARATIDVGQKWHRMVRVGKGTAGRLLDGVEHNGFPAP